MLPGTNDFILSQMSDVTSLFEAMKVIARSYNLLHGGEFNSVRKHGDVVTFIIDDKGFPYAIKDNEEFIAFSIECVLIFLHCMLKVIAPDHAERALRKISVTRAHRDETAQHLSAWSAPIRFGAPTYSIDYDGVLASSRIKPPPPELLTAAHVHAEIIRVAERDAGLAASKRTEDFVRSAVERGVIDQTRVAALLGVSAATLRRRLEEEGVTFRKLRRDVLNAAAKKRLKRGLGVSEVAEELGFSDFRSFNRAFKSWNGETPAAFAQRFSGKTI
ncbi:MAG: helix-turn-helix domain-containing protein [Parvularculaceae bacterium]|nr:helix-turn-helix domain-containing protein [Parvularculaceae bacterium]